MTKCILALAGTLLTILAVGCVNKPRYKIEVDEDIVRANDPEVAKDVSMLLARGRGVLAKTLPALADTGVEVWVQETPMAPGYRTPHFSSAFVMKRPGRRPRIHVAQSVLENAFLHELTHALLDESWRPLQLAIEEGLCELVSHKMADVSVMVADLRCAAQSGGSSPFYVSFEIPQETGDPERHSTLWGNSGGSDSSKSSLTVADILSFTSSRELNGMSSAEVAHIYGVGYLVVFRIVSSRGINGLHEVCLRSTKEGFEQIPAEWLLEAAEIESQEHFERVADEALRSGSIHAAFLSDEFERVVRAVIEDPASGKPQNPDEFLKRSQGTLKIDGESIDLTELLAFREWLTSNWQPLHSPVGE